MKSFAEKAATMEVEIDLLVENVTIF